MDTERLEEIKEEVEEFLNPDGYEREIIDELIAAIEEEWAKQDPHTGRPQGRKMAEWKRDLINAHKEIKRLEKELKEEKEK